MSLKESLGPHLPYLRRYARALTGSQDSGDAYIRASLAALAQDPTGIDKSIAPRVELYRYFHAIWTGTGAKLETAPARAVTYEARLQALAPVQRQAFLLSTVEGFDRESVAYILGAITVQVDTWSPRPTAISKTSSRRASSSSRTSRSSRSTSRSMVARPRP